MVPAGTRALIVEGVGATRQALTPLLDAAVWVQADSAELARRNAVRVAVGEITTSNQRAWMAEEDPFLLADRPWERATAIVAGTPDLPHDPRTEVAVAGGRRSAIQPVMCAGGWCPVPAETVVEPGGVAANQVPGSAAGC